MESLLVVDVKAVIAGKRGFVRAPSTSRWLVNNGNAADDPVEVLKFFGFSRCSD